MEKNIAIIDKQILDNLFQWRQDTLEIFLQYSKFIAREELRIMDGIDDILNPLEYTEAKYVGSIISQFNQSEQNNILNAF